MASGIVPSSDREQLRTALYGSYATTTYSGQADRSRRPELRHYRTNLLPYLPSDRDAAVIDLGCGAGAFVQFMRDCGYSNVRGVDISAEQVAIAQRHGIESVEEADALAVLASSAETFDAIVAIDLIEHLTRLEALEFLTAVRGALKPGGRVILHTVNAAAPFFGRIRYGDLTHETAFDAISLEQAFRVARLDPYAFRGPKPTGRLPLKLVRRAIVAVYRWAFQLYLAAETGVPRGHIVSESLVAVARRSEWE